jgi:hypothetical protein
LETAVVGEHQMVPPCPLGAGSTGIIAAQRAALVAAGLPVISVDAKRKELIGNFKNGGRAWSKEAEAVNVHDFPQDVLGRAVPDGIYDMVHLERDAACPNWNTPFDQDCPLVPPPLPNL